MNNSNVIIRNCVDENFAPIKIEYYDPLDSGRVVSQTYLHPPEQHVSKIRKMQCNVPSSFPKIALKRPENFKSKEGVEVVLVNGCWDTSNKIPNIVAEMHNVNTAEFNPHFYKNGDVPNESRDMITSSPRGYDSGIESDCTDGNLSWLLNYKIHELPPVPDALNNENAFQNHQPTEIQGAKSLFQPHLGQIPRITDKIIPMGDENRNLAQSYRYSGPKKPPFTYTELIEYALSEKGELTVSGIYQWISDHFPFYKQNDDRWKNSVRHNLSINPHFRKGGKAVQGAGHLWTMAQRDDKKSWQIKQRVTQFIQSTYADTKAQEQAAFDKELQAATESIVGEISIRNSSATNNATNASRRGSSNIEVEYINFGDAANNLEDFLSPPVSKQEIVDECGLGSDFFITDINPNALGLNLVESEAITEDGIYEDVFEYYELKD